MLKYLRGCYVSTANGYSPGSGPAGVGNKGIRAPLVSLGERACCESGDTALWVVCLSVCLSEWRCVAPGLGTATPLPWKVTHPPLRRHLPFARVPVLRQPCDRQPVFRQCHRERGREVRPLSRRARITRASSVPAPPTPHSTSTDRNTTFPSATPQGPPSPDWSGTEAASRPWSGWATHSLPPASPQLLSQSIILPSCNRFPIDTTLRIVPNCTEDFGSDRFGA